MQPYARRQFLKHAAGLIAIPFAAPLFDLVKHKPLFSFSTLGCPNWTFETIVKCAAENAYQGIELRGLKGELDLTKCPEFSPVNLNSTKRVLADKGLKIIGLGSSAKMHLAAPAERQKNLDEAKRFIELAQKLDCPYVRVFPDDLPKDQDRDATIQLIIQGLQALASFAKDTKVSILLESHGKVVSQDLLHQIMSGANHPKVGLIWDIWNMWSVTKESPKAVYAKLKPYIKHIHVKDAKTVDGKPRYVPIGQGDCPLAEALTALNKGGFKGFYSFEWEKMWHPELEEPEEVLPEYPKLIREYFK
jgi:sugar phosphate isomerase/epimerase